MALSRDIYREIEDIVGTGNISDDQAVLETYSMFNWGGAPTPVAKDRYAVCPEAIVLPGSAKEVQAIIKLCNRRGIRSKAIGTGYGGLAGVSAENTITLDLRRMNRLLDIDEKNMIVLVEPYVSFVQVQAEAQKRGLNTHIIGAGCQTSYVASHTSVVGNNSQAISHGYSARNLFGVEWVQPNGEMVRLGAPGSGAGWFSGDGPGPSLRGIIRGAAGATGGLGVFTKCAGHLHPWPGPKGIEVKGTSPYYEAVIPPLFEYHVLEWPTWEQCADAQYKIGSAGIAMAIHKTGGPGSHGACVTGCNNEYYEARQAGKFFVPEVSWAIVMGAHTEAEHDYQVKTLNKILEDTGGKYSPTGEDPAWKNPDFLTMVRACFIPRLAFRLTGTFDTDNMMGQETVDNAMMAIKRDGRIRDKYVETGGIVDDGIYQNWAVTYESGHWGLLEGGYPYNNTDWDSIKTVESMMKEGEEISLSMPIGGVAWTAMGPKRELLSPLCGNFQDWMAKIKKQFDPNTASDPAGYIMPAK